MKPISHALAAALVTLAVGPVAAQSDYGCRNLQTADPMAMIEGSEGVFYRLNLNMRMSHPLSERAAAMVGRLAEELKQKGTTLVYLPVPTKSLAMPGHLPDSVSSYGFDIEIAEQAYDAFIGRLRDAGVTTVDTMRAMREADGKPFIGTDFHWSSTGARAVAGAVAEKLRGLPVGDELAQSKFETRETEMKTISSKLRQAIQSHCRESVPAAQTQGYETTSAGGGSTEGGIFASDSAGPPIALAGTSMSDGEEFHFEGFLSQAAGASIANYSITGGNQFGALTSYLLSEDFQSAPPAVLVWENPIYNNLGEFGAAPLKELLAAAGSTCEPLETRSPEPKVMAADLPREGLAPTDFIRVDTGAATGREATFDFATEDGLTVGAHVRRPPRYEPTRWFYQHVRPVWREELSSLRVTLDQPVESGSSLSICQLEETST